MIRSTAARVAAIVVSLLAVSALIAVPSAQASRPAAAAVTRPLAVGGLPPTCADPNPWRFAWVGDSMTDGMGQRPYWSWLWGRLATVPRASYGTISSSWGPHDGIPGQAPGQLLARIDSIMAADRPDVVVLDIGTNLDGDGPTTLANVGRVVDRILAANPCARLLVTTVSYDYDASRSTGQQWINARIPRLVTDRDPTGTQIRWVDTTWAPLSGLIDRIHWTTATADVVSWYVWHELQFFVGVTINGERRLPYSAVNLAQMPARTGSATTG